MNQEFPVLKKLDDATASVLDFWLHFHDPIKNVVISKSLFVEQFVKVTERKIIPDQPNTYLNQKSSRT